MKLKYNLIAIALLGFSFSSCSDFLEQNPQTDLSENDFYKTADDILSAVNGAYSSLQEPLRMSSTSSTSTRRTV